MGAWSVSITGNDAAQDLKKEYQAAFFYNDVETALAKLEAYVRKEYDEDEYCDYYYSLADFMWKHGILTDEVRNKTVEMIDSGTGLDLWEESGTKTLDKRKKVLAEFRDKLLSPQPPKKKIKMNLYLKPIFETGDLVAIQLQTANKYYIAGSPFSEQFFRECDGKYVVVRKVADTVSWTSRVEPRVKDIFAYFELYGKIFDTCPTMEDLTGVPAANAAKLHCDIWNGVNDMRYKGTFYCEGSMFYFRKRKYVLIGRSMKDLPAGCNAVSIFLGADYQRINADTELLTAILG